MEEETNNSGGGMSAVKVTVIVLLSVFILGPLLLIGSCLPFYVAYSGINFLNGQSALPLIILVGVMIVCLAIFILVVYLITKMATRKNN